MNKPKNKISPLRQTLILIVLAASIFVIERQISVWLGMRAVSDSGLTSLSIEEAFTKAKNDQRPLMVNFSAYWCGYCRAFEKGTLSNTQVQKTILDNFHYVRLEHTESEQRLWFDRYQVTGFPTVLIISPDGVVTGQLNPSEDANTFIKQIL